MNSVLSFLVILLKFSLTLSHLEDYYWRDYTGTIPTDAIIGGQDVNSRNIYIGQAYVDGKGLIVSEIFSGETSVRAPIDGVRKVDSYIKILCGNQPNFYWALANNTNLHLQLIDKKPVLGGHERGGILFIGRIKFQENTKIGKVVGFIPGDAKMYFSHKDQEKPINSYEILLFNDNNVDVRIAEK